MRPIPRERVREAIVEPAGTPICEAEGEDLEGWDAGCDEPAPKLEVEEGAPVRRSGFGRRRTGHNLEGFTEVWRMLAEVHDSTVHGLVDFV